MHGAALAGCTDDELLRHSGARMVRCASGLRSHATALAAASSAVEWQFPPRSPQMAEWAPPPL